MPGQVHNARDRGAQAPSAQAGIGPEVVQRIIERAEVNVAAPAGPEAGDQLDNGQGGRRAGDGAGLASEPVDQAGDLGAEAASAAGLDNDIADQVDQAARRISGEELVRYCEMAKLGLTVLIVKRAKLGADVVARLAPIPDQTRTMLLPFADDAASFLPALNAKAPAIGALAFAAILAFDLWTTSRELRDLARAQKAEAPPRPAGPMPGPMPFDSTARPDRPAPIGREAIG